MAARLDDPVTLARRSAMNIGLTAYEAIGRRLEDPEKGSGVLALQAVDAARTGLEILARQAVERARAEGASWADVGHALGTTKQAAHERYGRPGAGETP